MAFLLVLAAPRPPLTSSLEDGCPHAQYGTPIPGSGGSRAALMLKQCVCFVLSGGCLKVIALVSSTRELSDENGGHALKTL